jgi:hypothetical protein
MGNKLFTSDNGLLRLFFIFLGVPLFLLIGNLFGSLENFLIEPNKGCPLGYISSVMFLTNFTGIFIAGIIFLFILREKTIFSFSSLALLAVFVDFLFAPSDNPIFFHSLWGDFLKQA